MDLVTFGGLYIAVVASLLFILLFGDGPTFSGTLIPKLHWLITSGSIDAVQ